MTMLGQSWMDEVLGEDSDPDPRREGEPATIAAVVDGFLRNDAGFSRSEVATYINRALQNEAGDLHTEASQAMLLAEHWSAHAEASGAPGPVEGFEEAAITRYDQGRAELAEVVAGIRETRSVPLEQETCDWLVRLDHDGKMSEAMAVDVPVLFAAAGKGPAPEARGAQERVFPATRAGSLAELRLQRAAKASVVDYSKTGETTGLSAGPERGSEVHPGPEHKTTALKREPVQAGAVMRSLVTQMRQGAPSTEGEPVDRKRMGKPGREEAGPELG